ncbi:Fic family protein [Leptospira wolffii]|uniref:Fic family protein n=1 Tax=Leptospira wolffii TaxID=409998 RepID=UPI0002D4395F|nr:Fic family protein [Leptospira wolffii]EPG65759.1 Fic/DOC family protein [Leptospira wolffii serovar Khorat str. Khorat-H2]
MKFKSGSFVNTELGFRAFRPEFLNGTYRFDEVELQTLLEQANLKLGELNGYAEIVPDVDHFIYLHVIKEATVSSKIEGTQTKMEEALLHVEEVEPEKRDDWQEVNNYISAMNESIEGLSNLPLSSRLLKQAHRTLLTEVRGEHKLPGEFRSSQNWIGGSSPKNALFVPPIWQDVNPLMGDLENFLHNENTGLPHLIKIALAHYQFETIHPFLDGNGRIGRLLITLYFIHAGVMKKPLLYLSDFFDRNRSDYYEYLMSVRTRHDLRSWLRFFLMGTLETSNKAIAGLKKIIELKKDCETKRIPKLGKKMNTALVLMLRLFNQPLIRPVEVAEITGQSLVSTYSLIEDFVRLNILKEITGGQRNRIYIFQEYFRVFE